MKTCEACDEQWDDSFFCDTCSAGGEIIDTQVGDSMIDGYFGEEWIPNGNICLNCCTCHYRNAFEAFRNRLPEKVDGQDEETLPF